MKGDQIAPIFQCNSHQEVVRPLTLGETKAHKNGTIIFGRTSKAVSIFLGS